MDDFKISTDQTIALMTAKPSYNITFHRDGGEKAGELDFNGPEMKFTGNVEESGRVFFDWIAQSFAQRLKDERAGPLGEVEKLITALRQARFFIDELGPTGIDKDLTLRFIDMALKSASPATRSSGS